MESDLSGEHDPVGPTEPPQHFEDDVEVEELEDNIAWADTTMSTLAHRNHERQLPPTDREDEQDSFLASLNQARKLRFSIPDPASSAPTSPRGGKRSHTQATLITQPKAEGVGFAPGHHLKVITDEGGGESDFLSTSPNAKNGIRSPSLRTLSPATYNKTATWYDHFATTFTKADATEYAKVFTQHRIRIDQTQELTLKDMKELGIPIGHRKVVLEIAARASSLNKNKIKSALEPSLSVAAESPMEKMLHGSNVTSTRHMFRSGFEWYDYEGTASNQAAFLDIIENSLLCRGKAGSFPTEFMDLFVDNKPLPFTIGKRNSKGRMCSGVLLRIVSKEMFDNVHKKVTGGTMASMTNRLIIMYLPKGDNEGVLLTYHKEPSADIPWLEEIKDDWVTFAHMAREAFVGHVLTECSVPTKIVLDAYRKNLESLQDLQVSVYPTAIVQWFNVIARQTQVLKRCLNANCGAVEEFGDSAHIDVHGVLKVLKDLSSNAEELVQNSVDAMALRMGLVDFRSQENMRVFTYISAVTSPLTVLTGWYGMNFGSMPELTWEFGYVTFSAVAGGVAIAMILLMRWLHRDTHTVGEEELERMVQSDTTHEVSVFVHHTRNSVDVWTPPSPRSGTPTARNGTPILNRGTPTL